MSKANQEAVLLLLMVAIQRSGGELIVTDEEAAAVYEIANGIVPTRDKEDGATTVRLLTRRPDVVQ